MSEEETQEVKEEKKNVFSVDKAIKELRKEDNKRKFIQTVDLIVNLQNFDVRKESLNSFIQVPHASAKKIAGFLTRKTELMEVITEADFVKYKDVKDIKRLAKKYDSFMAAAPLMAKVATTFGRVLGPIGKMPSPQAGIIPVDTDDAIKAMLEKMKKAVRVRTKEKSVKIAIGKEDMSDEELKENIEEGIKGVEGLLPKGKENVKNILIKLTMSKAVRVR